MPIAALPTDVVRQLGSSIAIVTPADLVKELVENAIDASATSIEVLISPDTLDRIEVRDNGHGVHQSDYNALGRSGCTSKIRTFEDIQTLGGTTLGFRGQALASANALGKVAITTRTIDETTAWALQLVPGVGGVETQKRTSGPVGTTVSVRQLFKQLPVRRRLGLKDATRTASNIKQMLYAYAMARPRVRLRFKILGLGTQQSWCYSPRPQANIKEAVIQVFGAETMSQFVAETISSMPNQANDGTEDEQEFVIEAILPKPGQVSSKLPKGSFFAIDSRPVSSHRGTAKLLLATFRSHIAKSALGSEDQKVLKNSLLCVNIHCPSGSYDPNLEPSKNDVSFMSPFTIMELFERLCKKVYHENLGSSLTKTVYRIKQYLDNEIETEAFSSTCQRTRTIHMMKRKETKRSQFHKVSIRG
ncbi:histidine kinase-like ATPase [Coniella lustricola]|uniref:Histidine kinase-like ATPase n=1 Tax=Coniella lustricola TaxID=2025994 RepID=A0A2T3ABG5_9PEZI|nr:histidine kinase-like ATPase [Coniella lustricola]